MKKRLLSLALCLALCLGLLPVGVLAADGGGVYVPPGSSTEGGGGVYEAAAETAAASLTIGDVTSYYQTLDDTVAAANEAGGEQVIKLYQDYDGKYATGNKPIVLNNGTITLNLNGHALKKICLTAQESRVEITGNGSVSQVLASGQNGKLVINSETVTVTAFTYAQNGGRLELSAGTYNGALAVYADSSASLSGGTYQRIYGTRLAGVAPKDLLADGKGYKFTSSQRWVSYMYLETGQESLDNVTVTNAPIENMTLTASNTTITYGDTLTLTATTTKANGVDNGKIISYQWYNGTEEMSGENNPSYTLSNLSAGNYTFRCVATCDNYPLIKDISITVTPVDLNNATVKIASLTYNGSEQSPKVEVKLGDQILNASTDYTVDVTPRTDAGSYTLTVNGMGNYTGTATGNWSITPKTVTNPTIELSSGPFTYTGQKIEPTITVMDEDETIPDSEYTVSYESNTNAGTAKIIITDKENGNYTVSGNTTFTIDKAQATCTPPTANDLTYNGTAQQLFGPGSTQDGTLVYSMYRNGGYVEYGAFCATSAKNYTIWYKVMGDSNHTMPEVNSITVTIKPAPLTVTAKDRSAYVGSAVPTLPTELVENTDYTVTGLFKEDKLTKTPKLSYVATPDMSKVGEFVVNISEADAESNYTITYVPGKLTITTRPSSGGSGNTGTKTDTVKNPDGSTTKTETKADGSKTETTTATTPGGSTGSTVTKTDTKGNSQTEANAKLSDKDVKDAQETGEAVTVPVKDIEAGKDSNSATEIKIDVPKNSGKTTVEIPVDNVTSGTVAVIVHPDGTEELVKDSKPTEHGVQLELSGSTTVKIIDNSKTFDDTKDHWSRDEVNFVAARELFNGVGGNQFGVSQPMTRGMVNTVLARLAGVDTTPGQGQAWYEVGTDWAKKNGISDGTNPTAPVTREQLATLLYRYAGSPSVSGTLHAADAASVSDYAEDALLWANQNGIVNGVGSNTIAPKDNAQRAQVAAMLARYLQNQ